MTPEFSVKFIINRVLGTFKIELTDTADYTGVSTAYGFYKITYPDGIFHESTDVGNPDFELGDFVSEINLRTKNSSLITGQYTIQQKVYANTGYFTLTKSFSFSFMEPVLSVEFAGNLLTPTVIFEDTTDYNVANYTEVITREISCNFPAHLPISGTELTSATTTLDMVDAGDYYEGIYNPTLNASVVLTGTEHTIEWIKESDFEISVKRLLSYDELLELFNQQKARLDDTIGQQSHKQTLEDYQTISALFDHIQLKIKAGESGIDALMIELQDLVYSATCCAPDDYEYSEDPLTEFDYSEVIESGFNIVANADGTDQFTSAVNKEIRFEGINGATVSFDPVTNKVIISSEEAQRQTEELELELEALQVNEEDFEDIRFDRIGGYIYGTKGNPVTDVAMSIILTGAKKFVGVKMYHQSDSVPTFDLGDTVSIKEIGSYITSQLNEIVIIHSGNTNINIAYLNDGESVQDGLITVGTIGVTTETTVDISGFQWRIAGDLYSSGTITDLPITGLPTAYDRVDLLVGDSNGDVLYVEGIESEDQAVPAIPFGTILLATLFRNLDGTVVEIPEIDLSDFVSKSASGNQTIQSDLTINAQSGTIKHFYTPDINGKIVSTRSDFAGSYVTKQGIGWSKIVEITLDSEFRYVLTLEFTGIESASFEQGLVFISFDIDGSNDISNNQCKLFGSFNAGLYVLVKTDTNKYSLFLDQTNAGSFYRFRPIFSFGGKERYEYFNEEDLVSPLPAGDQYFFTNFIGGLTVNDGLVAGGIVSWTGTGYVYDISAALVRYLGVLLPWIPYDQVTLDAADATFPRKDVIVVEFSDSFTGFKAITGEADSVDAVEPQLEDYATQIKLTVIDVAAGSTSPSITGEQVYDENLEWDVESTGIGTVNPASVSAPWVNLYSIEVTNCQNGFRLILNRTTPFDYDSFDVQSLRLKQKTSLGAGQSLGVQFLDSTNTPVTNIVPLSIVKADLNYQYLAIAKESFTPIGINQAQKLAIVFTRVSGGATYSGFFVDDWKIQSGIIQSPTVTTIQLTNEVSASGAANAPIPVSLTEKAISNRAEELTWADDDFLLFWKAADQVLYKIKKSNLGIDGGGGLTIDEIIDGLEAKEGEEKLSASALKDLPTVDPVTDVFTWTTGAQEFTLSEANVGDPDVYLNTTLLNPAKWSISAGVVTITETLPPGFTHNIFIKYYKTTLIGGYPEVALSAENFFQLVTNGTVFIRGGNVPQDTSGGITLTFRKDTIYGTPASPLSGAIADNFTGDNAPNLGAEAILWYNAASLSLDSKYKRIHGTYSASVLNKIIFRYYSATYITYQIYQEL